MALDPATAWAEWRTASGGAVDPADEVRRLWTLDVVGLEVIDLRDPVVREALDADLGRLAGPREHAQRLAASARAAGAEGIVLPSAAHAGHWTLVVFPPGFSAVRVVKSREMHPQPPG